MPRLDDILDQIKTREANSTARQPWNPSLCGDIDIRIASDGTWYHEGSPFRREQLVKLFASVLRREADGEYYLLTPAEKMRIRVDDAPFVAVQVEQLTEPQPSLLFTTNLGEQVVADAEHPIRVEFDPTNGQPRPYIHFRDNLDALISRNVYMALVDIGELFRQDGHSHLGVTSQGVRFDLGSIDE
ncbi:DUF1285 domain-containing protein [Sedimenticola selenatireducens]|uniref:DUF1285 domain-containing protein n=1 Tax=Sedimenticola selenatireducens TaxID=191960 RepID=A0A2N6CUH9_9GAMM|nr:DUF1285 domain-containing protein [Sedimenticola selenatireducens]PLX60831.1 MAG: DUF1285 domain-containing protein [Sedimenticola selenatireducens]